MSSRNEDRLNEAYSVPDTFCEGLARIEQIGGCRRLIFAVRDIAEGTGGHVVVARLILPAEAMADLARMIAADRPVPREFASLSFARAN